MTNALLNLGTFDWWPFVVVGVGIMAVVLAVLTLAYAAKRPVQMPPRKPGFCPLPKYRFTVDVPMSDPALIERRLTVALAELGFDERPASGAHLKFTRGSALGDFSIDIAKVIVRTNRPVANPVELEVVYGTLFGTAFDTGDLWKFCNELRDKLVQLPWAEIVE